MKFYQICLLVSYVLSVVACFCILIEQERNIKDVTLFDAAQSLFISIFPVINIIAVIHISGRDLVVAKKRG